jgi:hypothetical protein
MIHNISYRVFINVTEDEDKVLYALKTIFPNAKPKKEIIEGYYGNLVISLSEKFDKKQFINEFISSFLDMDKNELNQIKNNLEIKTDYNGNLFLRFDKQKAYDEKWKVVTHGDSIHVKLKVAAYPAKQSTSVDVMSNLIDSVLI